MDKFMRQLYFDHDEDRDKGPHVSSDDIEERIAARRLRIQERLDSLQPGYYDEIALKEESPLNLAAAYTNSRKQVETSFQRIVNLCRNGNAFITNLKVACDAREHLRRLEEEELAVVRHAKMEAERKETEKLFEDVEFRWEQTEGMNEAHELHSMFEDLKATCAKIIDEKNKLIYDIHLELKAKDDHFVKELKKRSEDVDIIVERMESQMKSMEKAYDFELREIEKAFLEDREKLLQVQNSDWEDFMAELKKKQEDYLVERRNRINELEELIQKLRTNHTEEFNALKLRLSTEVQNMETDLQQMKVTYQLNLEKLEYNFQVLKRRDEENTLTRSQQKRKITQLQDQLNKLRVFAKKQTENLKYENSNLSEDYKKMMESFRELQKKSKMLIKFEEQNFRDIWVMNEEELRKDAKKLMDADKVIMEQQLGQTWTPPEASFMNNNGPISLAEKERRKSSLAARTIKQSARSRQTGVSRRSQKCRLPQTLKEAPKEIVDAFLDMLAFEPEFLIENKVKAILKGLPREDQKLVRLDAVLTVLEVNSEELLDKLFTYFLLPCDGARPQIVEVQQKHVPGDANEPDCPSSTIQPKDSSASRAEATTFNEEIAQGDVRLIDPVDIPRVLHRFTLENCPHAVAVQKAISNGVVMGEIGGGGGGGGAVEGTEGAESESGENPPLEEVKEEKIGPRQQDLLDMEMDRAHWQKYIDTFAPEEKRRMWEGLKKVMQRYLATLKSRSSLIVDNEALRRQNAELKHLLQLYSCSEASKRLEVGPLSTMKLS